MKVIFLDIDGVLNSEITAEKMIAAGKTEADYDFVDEEKQSQLIKFLDYYCIKLVISSSWRIDGYKETCEYFNKTLCKPLIPYIIGVTPRAKSGFRGTEIDFFLHANRIKHEDFTYLMKDDKYVDISEYCIIDDDDDMTDEQKESHFVQTSWYDGLCDKHYPIIKEILKVDEKESPEEELKKCMENPKYFFRNYAKVKDKRTDKLIDIKL